MLKRAFFGLTALIVLGALDACVIHYVAAEKIDTIPVEKRAGLGILGIQKKNGEYVEFLKKEPATIEGDRVIGRTYGSIVIEKKDVQSINRHQNGKLIRVGTSDGKAYDVISGQEKEDRIIIQATSSIIEQVSIPFSDIDFIRIERTNAALSLLIPVAIYIYAVYWAPGFRLRPIF